MRKIFFLFLLWATPVMGQGSLFQTRISIFKQNFIGGEPIQVTVSFFNRGAKEESFAISEVIYQSITFDLRTAANEEVPLLPQVDARMRTVYSNPQLHRRITLAPGELFSHTFDLRDYFVIDDSGSYYVRARFYPDPDNRASFFQSEYAAFSQSPPSVVRLALERRAQEQKRDMEEAARFLPNEVIQDLFEAQMARDWQRFLFHIDPERLIYAFQNYAGQYEASIDGTLRLELIEQFKRFLTGHWDLALTGYEIQETRITGETAQVTVDALETVRISQRKIRYLFSLYRNSQGQWLIDNYEVLVIN